MRKTRNIKKKLLKKHYTRKNKRSSRRNKLIKGGKDKWAYAEDKNGEKYCYIVGKDSFWDSTVKDDTDCKIAAISRNFDILNSEYNENTRKIVDQGIKQAKIVQVANSQIARSKGNGEAYVRGTPY